MKKNTWGVMGGWVVPFKFKDTDKEAISNELKKHILVPDDLTIVLSHLEKSIEYYKNTKKDYEQIDDRETTKANLNKTIKGLSKAIDSLQSLDQQTQENFKQSVFTTEENITGIRNTARFHQDPTEELTILLESTKLYLNVIRCEKHSRRYPLRILVGEIVKIWRQYALNGKDVENVRYVWRDHKKKPEAPETSLWLIVKLTLACAGVNLADPSHYIQEALDSYKTDSNK